MDVQMWTHSKPIDCDPLWSQIEELLAKAKS